MAICRIAVRVDRDTAERQSKAWLISAIAFGRVADDLARLRQGNPVVVSGQLQRSYWHPPGDVEREQWTVIADAVNRLPR